MISRVIEAKPEDLRAFLEEAAGISKYKERRRETENRIRNTQENLARITDITSELDKQLQHLQRQAKSAERYQELKTEERTVQSQLLALRWRSIGRQLERFHADIEQRSNAVEATMAALRSAETDIVRLREGQVAASDHFNEVQSAYYSAGADVARLEQQIQYAEERRLNMERELAATDQSLAEARQHIGVDDSRLQTLQQELQQLEPRQHQHLEAESLALEEVGAAETRLNDWQVRWDALVQKLADAQRQAHVEETRREHLEDAVESARQRLAQQQRERAALVPDVLQRAVEEVQERLGFAQGEHEQFQRLQADRQTAVQAVRDDLHRLSAELDELRQQRQQLLGRRASLEALQQSSMGTDRAALAEWLRQTGVADARRLSDVLEVEAGWDRAVEHAGRLPMQALCVDGLDGFVGRLDALHEGSAAALQGMRPVSAPVANPAVGLPLLASKIRAPWPVADLFNGIYAADSLAAARAAQPALADGESIITPDGTWLGIGWVRVDRDTVASDGLLQRSQALKALATDIADVEERIERVSVALDSSRARQAEVEAEEQSLRQQLSQSQSLLAGLGSEVASGRMRLEQTMQRLSQLTEELADLEVQLEEDAGELQQAGERLQQASALHDELVGQREALGAEREDHRSALQAARSRWQEMRDAGHALAVQAGAIQSERTALEQSLTRNRMQVERLQERAATLQAELQGFADPFAQLNAQRETALAERLKVEADLSKAREAVQQADAELRELEQRRLTIEAEVMQRREELERARLDARGLETRLEGVVEQLGAMEAQAEQVIETVPAEATESQWEETLAELGRKIQRLGPINLAAIDEFSSLSERKTYLDAQLADLTEALTTLEEAIRKIDRETRTRFKETFDKVNTGFQTLFPILFGGGHAVLELTGEDLLETGVSVIARPPGKRNSTIHLLSGGEKALTAVSLVFAIFELNPAPFCLLDEVDAPLDDANVVRLCDMLKQRSRDIQFIFITHNKITMEIADQLVGVTMQEAGVSRLVAVNMDEAVRLAATA
jgi:chromosome segregation protein